MEAIEKDIERFLAVGSGDGSGSDYGSGYGDGSGYGGAEIRAGAMRRGFMNYRKIF